MVGKPVGASVFITWVMYILAWRDQNSARSTCRIPAPKSRNIDARARKMVAVRRRLLVGFSARVFLLFFLFFFLVLYVVLMDIEFWPVAGRSS